MYLGMDIFRIVLDFELYYYFQMSFQSNVLGVVIYYFL